MFSIIWRYGLFGLGYTHLPILKLGVRKRSSVSALCSLGDLNLLTAFNVMNRSEESHDGGHIFISYSYLNEFF